MRDKGDRVIGVVSDIREENVESNRITNLLSGNPARPGRGTACYSYESSASFAYPASHVCVS